MILSRTHILTLFFLASILFFAVPLASLHAATLSRPANQLGLVGHWTFDEGSGTHVGDSSGNKNSGTITGAMWVNGKYGPALYFDGDEDFVTLSEIGLQNNAPTITLSVWFKLDSKSVPQGHRVLAAFNSASYLSLFTDGLARPFVSLRIGGSQKTLNSGFLPDINTWHHMVATYDGDTMRIYVDGVERNTLSELSGGVGIDSVKYIGRYTSNPATSEYEFFGSMDDFRIYSRALSATEVQNLYRGGGVVRRTVDSTGLAGHWTFDEGSGTQAGDASSSRNHGTLAGGVTWTDGIRGKALYFDGVDGWVDNITQPNIQTGPNVFTITGFMKPGNQDSRFITPNSNGRDQFISFDSVNQTIRVSVVESANINGRTRASSNGSVPLNTWTHFAISINDKNIKIYINGKLDSEYDESIDIANWTGNWAVGQRGNSTFWYLGALDDIRVYNRELSPGEVQRIYESGNVTANTSSVTLTKNTSLADGLIGHWTFDGKDITTAIALDRSGNDNHGTLVNTPRATIGKLGQALEFNRDNETSVTVGNTASVQINQGTLSAWVRTSDAGGGYRGVVQKNNAYGLYFNANIFGVYDPGTGLFRTTETVLNDNRWHHVVATFDSGVTNGTHLFINGEYIASVTQTISHQSGVVQIGRGQGGPGQIFNGSIDDVRIYNRMLSADEVKQLYNLGR